MDIVSKVFLNNIEISRDFVQIGFQFVHKYLICYRKNDSLKG